MRRDVPHVGGILRLFALRKHGYVYASRAAAANDSDTFSTRLWLPKVVIARGDDAARQFYRPGRMSRRTAQLLPARILQEKGTVPTLEGAAHRERKALFTSLLGQEDRLRLTQIFEFHWRQRLPQWSSQAEVDVLAEVRQLLCTTACEWAGVGLDGRPLTRRTNDLALLVDAAGSLNLRLVWARRVRKRTTAWVERAVTTVRKTPVAATGQTPLETIARFESDGERLSSTVAAGEVINLLRPIVAVARYIVFAAIALHEHPGAAAELKDEQNLAPFVQEVRRFYPFFPLVAGRVLQPFDWRGRHFRKGRRFILDLYGTNHDPDLWEDPHVFRPERFARNDAEFSLIPQGAGDPRTGHRCAGEQATIDLVKSAVRLLRTSMTYDVPPQDYSVPLNKIPALPRQRFVITNVQPG